MALKDYKMKGAGAGQTIRAPTRSKQRILGAVKRDAMGEGGLSQSQKESAGEEARLAGAQQGKTVAEDLAQAGLGSGWGGQMAEAARQTTKGSAAAGAMGSADAGKYSEGLARQFSKETNARLEAQQNRASQNSKFWTQQGLNIAKAIPGLAASFKGITG